MNFCTRCGKKLNEGEICECKTSETAENIDVNSMDTNVLAVKSKKSIPYVSEILNVFMRTVSKNTVKQVSLSSKENSILWIFIMLIESFINSLMLTVIIRSLSSKLMEAAIEIIPFIGGTQSGSTSKLLSNIGLGFFSLFFRMFVIGIVVFFVTSGLIYILLKICKKKGNFNNIANMVSTASIPLTFLSIIGFVLSFILPQVSILIFIVALTSALILMYLGIQKIDKFTESPFWIYIALIALLLIVSFFAAKLLMPAIKLDQIFSGVF